METMSVSIKTNQFTSYGTGFSTVYGTFLMTYLVLMKSGFSMYSIKFKNQNKSIVENSLRRALAPAHICEPDKACQLSLGMVLEHRLALQLESTIEAKWFRLNSNIRTKLSSKCALFLTFFST